ncbi:MAG: nicotinate phosphoribosyltransferase [Alphaproteobacteria bacterium]
MAPSAMMPDPMVRRFHGFDSPLLTDLYQLNMAQAYLERGMTETAVFEFFVRRLPARRSFLIAAGLDQALHYLENVGFAAEEIEWLRGTGRFSGDLIDYLSRLRFTGDVHAMPEGTAFFPDEPIVRVAAPLPVAQLVETRLINILHFQTLIASKAARMVLAAPGKGLVDFGLRRAHGGEAGLWAARASYLAGFAGSATVLAERVFGIPSFGTMAHSFVQAHEGEVEAFRNFAEARPKNLMLLIDTYDSERAAKTVVGLAPELSARGIAIRGVRLDSGDLADEARRVRRVLDEGGLRHVEIFASGGIDEDVMADLAAKGAPIDGFGIGTSLATSQDAPALDCAYKLQEYAGVARRKHSRGKATWPGRKQVWRRHAASGRLAGDTISTEDDVQEGERLLVPVMTEGRRIGEAPSLEAIRQRAAESLARLPEPMRALTAISAYPVAIAPRLRQLADEVDQRIQRMAGGQGAR